MRLHSFPRKRCAAVLLMALLAMPAFAQEAKPAAKAKPTAKTKVPAKPVLPEDLTAQSVRHVVVCPPPKISQCVMKRPVAGGYRVLNSGIEVSDDGANWIVDFGKGPKSSMFLLQVVDAAGSVHGIEVTFRAKPGMQKTPTLQEE